MLKATLCPILYLGLLYALGVTAYVKGCLISVGHLCCIEASAHTRTVSKGVR